MQKDNKCHDICLNVYNWSFTLDKNKKMNMSFEP